MRTEENHRDGMLCSFILCMEGYQLTTMRNTGVGKKSIIQIFGHGREPRLSGVISLMRVISLAPGVPLKPTVGCNFRFHTRFSERISGALGAHCTLGGEVS